MIHTSFATRAGETSLALVPSAWTNSLNRRLIVGCHGVLGSASTCANSPYEYQAIADRTGTVMVCPDLTGAPGASAAWGNDSSLGKITTAWTDAQTEFGVKTDKILLYGESMGLATALMYLIANPTKVAAVVGVLPCVNVDDIHDNNRSGLAASIETAYGGAAAWETAKTTRDPILCTSGINTANIPQLYYYSTDDTIAMPAQSVAYHDAVPASRLVSLGAVGHTIPSSLDVAGIADFLSKYIK